MQTSKGRVCQQTFALSLGDVLFINLWFGLPVNVIFSALIDWTIDRSAVRI